MNKERVVLGCPPVPSSVWMWTGAGATILDAPCYVNGVVQFVDLRLMMGQPSQGQCVLDVFSRSGDYFTHVRSCPLAVDYTRFDVQRIALPPVEVSKWQYLGLRMAEGSLWTAELEGASAHLWWNTDVLSGRPDKYLPTDSAGFMFTISGDAGEGIDWQSAVQPSTGQVMHYRACEAPGVYLVLPSAYLLSIEPKSGLPGFEPFLYLRDGAGAEPKLSDYRVRLRLRAVPWLLPAQRDFLMHQIQATTGRPAVRLQPAFDVPAKLSIAVGPAASTHAPTVDPIVDVRGGFTLEYDLPAAEYELVRQQLLASGGGIIGSVHCALTPSIVAAIPVQLSLLRVVASVVEIGRPQAPPGPGPHIVGSMLQLRNLVAKPVRVGSVVGRFARGADEPPQMACAAVLNQPTPIDLAPSQVMGISFHPQQRGGGPWRLWEWYVDGVELSDGSAKQWIDQIDRSPETGRALLPIHILCTNLAQRRAESADFLGVKILVPGSIPSEGFLRADASDAWNGQVALSLSEIVGAAGAARFGCQYRSVYAGGLGLLQAARSDGEWLILTALAIERPGCRYSVLGADGAAELLRDVDAAAADRAVAWLAAHRRMWRLAVLPPASAPAQPPDAVDVLAGLFESTLACSRAQVTLSTPDAPDPETFEFFGPSATAQRYRPSSGPVLPFMWQVTYFLADGQQQTESGTETQHPFVLLLPPTNRA